MKAPVARPASRPRTFLIVALSFGSGCAALLYQLVWFQLLEFVVGSSAVSLAVVLGTFMAGLCLGSFLLPRVIPPASHPLRTYALVELGIAAAGTMVLVAMPVAGRLYATGVGYGTPGILLRGLVSVLCLLPPSVLIGAALPALGGCFETTGRGASRLGLLYCGNTVGAVAGCLLGGFYLLRVYDLRTTTYVAAALNVTLAVASVLIAPSVARSPRTSRAAGPPLDATRDWPVYLAIGLSGVSALGAEVVWTRLLALLMGPTIYSFTLVLTCFLAGLSLGSGVGAALARRPWDPRRTLAWCQVLLTVALAFAAYRLVTFLPQQIYVPPSDLLTEFQSDVSACLITLLPAACLWGASVSLALASVASHQSDSGRLIGGVYAANTVGAVLGAIGTSVWLIPWLGTGGVQRLLVCVPAAGAVLLFASLLKVPIRWRRSGGDRTEEVPARFAAAPILVTVAVAGVLVVGIHPVPGLLIAFGPYARNVIGHTELLYAAEGMNASIAVTQGDGIRSFHVSGKVEASNALPDMQHLRMLGSLPGLIHSHPRTALVIGCGAGITAGSLVPYSSINQLTIVEIESLVPQLAARFFSRENYDVVHDPRATFVHDDGRHFMLTTSKTFDIITSDPIHPWVKGSAALYNQEYFNLVKQHLNPGGVVSQWLPLYESHEDVIRSEIATFFEVFPDATIWSTGGGDLVLLGQATPSSIDVDAVQTRLDRSPRVTDSLRSLGLSSAVELLATYSGRLSDLREWLEGAEINHDGSLRLQYRAGLHVAFDDPDVIYASMVARRSYPDDLFVASDRLKQELRSALGSRAE